MKTDSDKSRRGVSRRQSFWHSLEASGAERSWEALRGFGAFGSLGIGSGACKNIDLHIGHSTQTSKEGVLRGAPKSESEDS